MTLIGINRFIAIIKIDDLYDYDKNHCELIDPTEFENRNIVSIGSLALRETDIHDYNYYILNKNYKLVRVFGIFVPENKQFMILLNKNVKFPIKGCDIINKPINEYLELRLFEFYREVANSVYQNLKYEGYKFDPFKFLND